MFPILFPRRCRIGDTGADLFWVSEKSRHEWHGVTGQAPSLNIHLCTRILWITEKLLTDSFVFFLLSISLSLANQCCVYGYEHASVLFLHGHTSADAVKQIALLLRPAGNRNRSIRSVKSVCELWFLTAHTPASCLITLSVWRDVQTCIESYRVLV